MTDLKNRRPIDSRGTNWAHKTTQWLATRNITPNQISQISMLAAVVAGGAFWATAWVDSHVYVALLLVLAGVACQLRLLCNLFDGMVAVEAGKSAPDGPFWNEFPDRVSDIFILVGVGLAAGSPTLGFAAATFSVLTAYTRELGASIGLPPNFAGLMAKQHRMAVVTGAAVLSTAEPLVLPKGTILFIALCIVTAGAAITSFSRAKDIRGKLL